MNTESTNILIVEDEEKLRKLYVKILSKAAYKVDKAEDGQAGLEATLRKNYDLIIVDLNMPRMNGQTLIQEVGKTGKDTAIIVLTGHGDLEMAYELLEQYQISDFLTKPLHSPPQLLFSVKNTLEKQKLRRQILVYNQKLNGKVRELEESLAMVNKLSGLLPICASCKKIRDEKDNWEHLETYIRDHSEADFTHSICPDCRIKLYPELSKD